MQILTANGGAKTPGLTMLKPGTGVAAPVDKPTGYGPSGYQAAPPYPTIGGTPQTPVDKPTGVGPTGYGQAGNGGITITKPFAPVPAAGAKPQSQPNQSDGGGDGSQSIYNLDTDPIVARIKALNQQNYANAVSTAQSAAKQDLIGAGFSFGDLLKSNPDLANGILGSVLGDQTTQLAAQQNPYSTARQLFQAHDQNVNQIDQTDNANNLYYSSTRGNQQGQEANGYLGNIAAAQQGLGGSLSTLLQQVAQEKATEDQNLANAYDQARQNEIMNAINSGEILVGYDGNGNPIFTRGGGGSSGGGGGGSSTGSTTGTGGGNGTTTKAGPLPAALTHPFATPQTLAQIVAPARPGGVSKAPGRGVISIH